MAAASQSVFDSMRVSHTMEVYFAFGKHDISPETASILDSFAHTWLNLTPAPKIRITAHTDSVGHYKDNLALSQRRAQTIKTALAQRGLPVENIDLAYFGDRRPAANNTTDEGRQRNRRATLETFTTVPMVSYSGAVKDQKTGKGISAATVYFSTQSRRDSIETDTAGFFAVRLPKDSVVKTEAYAKGYFFESIMQRMYGTPEMLQQMQREPALLTLAPARAGEKAIIKNLFFVGDEAILLKSSEAELPKVSKFMQVNPDIHIEIAGHVNYPGVVPAALEKFTWTLSVNRAKRVFDYLRKNDIGAVRMSYKGYGNTEMLFPNLGASEAEQEQNRRVEIRVVEE